MARKLEAPAYKAFAKFLEKEGVCKKAKSFATGSREIWIPDVVGVTPFRNKGVPRIVSAEVKCYAPLAGVGQALAYSLFSSKVYLVIPRPETISKKDKYIKDLCKKNSISLVYFYGIKGRERYRHDSFKIEFQAPSLKPKPPAVEEFIELNKSRLKGLL